MAKVFVITHRKDGYILGVCGSEGAVRGRIAFLEDECAIFTVNDTCVDAYEVCE